MRDAYTAAAKLNRQQIERENPEDARLLRETQVVIVRGCYDRGEEVFSLCGIPATPIDAGDLARAVLHPDQILYVNCPGQLTEPALDRVRSFVHEGGLLVTTDWALRHVIERAFPGKIAYGGHATSDDVVRVVFEPVEDTFLEGLIDDDDDPLWWLEGSSYPIRVVDPSVRVLVKSEEMRAKWGEPAIVVAFEAGKGKVYHMTSHFYLQRTETRSKRHAQPGTSYAAKKGLALDALTREESSALASSSLSEVQTAYTSAKSLTNMVIEQGRRVTERKKSS